jgi:hypothetical protein
LVTRRRCPRWHHQLINSHPPVGSVATRTGQLSHHMIQACDRCIYMCQVCGVWNCCCCRLCSAHQVR